MLNGKKITVMMCASLIALIAAPSAVAQNASPIPDAPQKKLEDDILSAIGLPEPKLTPLTPSTSVETLPVKLLYDGPNLEGQFLLEVTLSKPNRELAGQPPQLISQSTIFLKSVEREMDALLNLTEETDGLQIAATLRDSNRNLILETSHPLPVISRDVRILRLSSPLPPDPQSYDIPDFTGVETISGEILLPPKSILPPQSTLHVQLLENALAGALSLELIAQDSRLAFFENGKLNFNLERGIWDRDDEPDLSFKAWITDSLGRKIFVMNQPVGYNGSDIKYAIRLEGLKQGRDTKLGLNLHPDLMAQTIIQGEAAFDPVNGIPGGARLKIELKQDRGDFNRNPILAQQTLILRGLETRIAFALTTDSTHFDPYAPAPFLSVALTDSNGRIYYESGDIRAREDNNSVRLFPR